MLELFSYPLILQGFIVLMASGLSFPIAGVYLLRMNLLPLRFMLMHGALLGGAIALAFQLDPFLTTMLINLVLVWFMMQASRSLKADAGNISIFIMVAAIGLAFTFISVFNVQAKDTLSLLWGSIFTISPLQTVGFVFVALFVVLFQLLKRNQLKAVFFDSSVAYSSGINESGIHYFVILLTALIVAVAMKLIGALLIDAVIILPALISSLHTKSMKSMIVWACIWGGVFSFSGFFVAYWLKIPTSSAIALIATLIFLIIFVQKRLKK